MKIEQQVRKALEALEKVKLPVGTDIQREIKLAAERNAACESALPEAKR